MHRKRGGKQTDSSPAFSSFCKNVVESQIPITTDKCVTYLLAPLFSKFRLDSLNTAHWCHLYWCHHGLSWYLLQHKTSWLSLCRKILLDDSQILDQYFIQMPPERRAKVPLVKTKHFRSSSISYAEFCEGVTATLQGPQVSDQCFSFVWVCVCMHGPVMLPWT